MQTVNVTPQDVVMGAPAGARPISPESSDIVTRMRDYYRQQGKAAAAANYSRHLKAFFGWAESQGLSIRNLPSDSVESFLSALAAAGQKETTLYVMRSQLKAALRDTRDVLGLDVGHLEYVTGKPPAVRKAQKEKEKAVRQAKKHQDVLAQAAAIQAAQAVMGMQTPTVPPPAPVRMPVEEYPMSEPTPPAVNGTAPTGASNPMQPTVIVVPQAPGANPAGNRATVANPQPTRPAGAQTAQPARGVTIANHTFTGAFVKISYLSDGSNPFNPPGTETYLTTMPASQLSPHGDVAAFLQQYIVPTMRLSPTTSQVAFVFHELNDRRQPTGRRDELVVGIPLSVGAAPAGMPPAPGLAGFPSFGASSAPQDSATTYLLKKLDEEAAEAKRRAEEYQVQMREAKDAQSVFMLTQAFQREQDLRKELEERRTREEARLSVPPPIVTAPPPPTPPMPLFPPAMFDPPKPDTSAADMVKALAEQNAKMMETVATLMKPQPLPPQKDTAEWLVPFIAQMNQQAQAQAQANQQMLMSVMQSNQQFMQAMLQKESPVERMLFAQLQEVKAAASAPKEDELESFADKLQKMKMVSDMMGGGGSSNLLTELLANADTIGAGAAKVIEAAKGNSLGGANAAPTKQIAQERAQLTGAPAAPKLPSAAPAGEEGEFPPPPAAALEAHKALVVAVDKRDDEATAGAFLVMLRELVTAQEPYASMGRRLMTAFQQAEDEGELYTLAKNLWIVVGQKSMRPQAKYVARVLAEYYSNLHQTVFGEARALPEDAELEDGAGEGAADGEADGAEAGDAGEADEAKGAA